VMAGRMADYAVGPGNVHFDESGSVLLGKKVAAAIESQLSADGGGETVLFDGSGLDAWLFDEGAWEIDSGDAMTCLMQEVVHPKTGEKQMRGRGDIWSRETYADFELSLGYKLSEGANSGVFYRSNMENSVQDGFEIQLMDNVGYQKTHGEKDPRKRNGSFYDCQAPSSDPQNSIGEWNTLTLRCQGPMIALKINGVEAFAVDVDDWDKPGENPDGTTNKFKSAMKDFPRSGRIGFQNHGQGVWFRDVKIRTQ
jgi:hypothetical protein